ncbi:MAG: EAL domain-containing protein [Aquabacterium sp.]|uniref:bifunctional diguanylate cyclase/phosphodiesterase n=1 Tax=Aquabacterium sp. TaxID=1872578 RepID=UPI0025C50887|nr:EAL domain-containing protein [Aquabacterium sp.]MBI3382115.1 EAL domain-containing protein [Aquabacterium sp.]
MLGFRGHSLKTRVTLLTLAILLAIIWSLALITGRALQHDLSEVLGAQQIGTAAIIAANIDNQLQERQRSIERVAASLNTTDLRDPTLLQHKLAQHLIFQSLFNGGTFVTRADGIALASLPLSAQRQGTSYMDRDYLQEALRNGKTSFGRPVMGRKIGAPALALATPIRDGQHIVGALVGVINLSQSSFLDSSNYSQISKVGNYLLVDARHRVIVTDARKQRVLEALPGPGVRPWADRFIAGFEGNATFVNAAGVEVFSSIKQIPSAGWYVAVQIPTAEAFAPITAMQRQIWLTALGLTLLASTLIWWMLTSELAPLQQTEQALTVLRHGGGPLQPLPLTRSKEINSLIEAINSLIAALAERQAALNESETLYRTAFRTNPDAVSIGRVSDGHFIDVNDGFTRVYGWQREETFGQSAESLGIWTAADRAALVEALGPDGHCQDLEVERRDKHGRVFSALVSSTRITLAGEPCVLTVTRDITDQKAVAEQIQQLAYTDPLTYLPNRRLLMDRLQQSIASSVRHQWLGALVYIDLDDFKTLNDTLGHDKGDLFLVEVADRLSASIRCGDTVARLGGDEFVVLLEHLSVHLDEAATQARQVAEKILAALNKPSHLEGIAHHGTASIGITLFGDKPESATEPLKRADLAMYQAKAAGRKTLCFFDPQMQAKISARVALEARLRDALTQQHFELHYQAQVNEAQQILGVEALVRWLDPLRGMVSPAEFIPLAEETGLILPLGAWVLETACRQLHDWAQRPDKAHLKISVNVSARQMHGDGFVEQVKDVLARTGAPPHRLMLELTESLLVTNIEATIAKMTAIKALGVSFSLDDFGTGFSSLSYLKRLPLDQLKIDRSFVRDILVDPNDTAIAKMVVALGNSLGLSVIAEGVETAAQRDALAALGCFSYQGFYFSKPLPVAQFESLQLSPA